MPAAPTAEPRCRRAPGQPTRASAPLAALALVALGVAAGCAAALLAAPARAQPAQPAVRIAVTRDGANYYIDASLRTAAPPQVAWDVLTDFDRMATFAPNVETSRATARSGNRVKLEQRGVARFGPLAFPFESQREIELVPIEIIRSRQTAGSLRHLVSLTTLNAAGTGTRIDYHVEVDPGALYPSFVMLPFLKREVAAQFAAIDREMRRRAGVQ
jgi:carbon monoxide dehydrogenase subunit G